MHNKLEDNNLTTTTANNKNKSTLKAICCFVGSTD